LNVKSVFSCHPKVSASTKNAGLYLNGCIEMTKV